MHFGEYELSPSLITFHPYPQVIRRLFNVNRSYSRVTKANLPRVDHKVSRLILLTIRPIRFALLARPEVLSSLVKLTRRLIMQARRHPYCVSDRL